MILITITYNIDGGNENGDADNDNDEYNNIN